VTNEALRGKYRIVRLLGEGGMGSVYEAEDTTCGARVALKVMRAEITKSAVYMARFDREVRASQAIRTPYIVDVLEAGTDEISGEPYMTMELLEGEDLKQLIQRLGPLPPDLAIRIAAQACIGLGAAHEGRIVHRDIKSANLFLAKRPGGERIVKLLDFGIAKEKFDQGNHAETAGLTRTGNMLGSPLYMSPEQVRGHKTIDHRADIWSLGVVLYEALTGQTPHQDVETLGELIITICSELPRPVQDLAPWVPPDIAALPQGAIRFDPAERFQTAGAILEALAPRLQGGIMITEDMLRPLSDIERSYVAPRLLEQVPQGLQSMQASIPGRSSSGSGGGSYARPSAPPDPWFGDSSSWHGAPPPDRTSHPPFPHALGAPTAPPFPTGNINGAMPPPGAQWPVDPNAPAYPGVSGTTFSPTSDSVRAGVEPASAPPRSTSTPLIALGALVALSAGGFAAYQLFGPSDPPAPAVAITDPSAAAAPSAASTSAGAGPTASATQEQSVSLMIVPSDASVWVDDRPAVLKEGRLEIKGELGSSHVIRVSAGGPEQKHVVVVAKDGAQPSKIEVQKGQRPAAQTTPAKAPPTTTSKPGPGPGLDLRTQR
jgi:serine/threonine-protein kinase